MGKGKRNRQNHLDNQVTPKKPNRKAKQPIVLPKWAKMAICAFLLVAILGGIIAASLINGGIVYRNRILIESESGKFDMNQQMATFVLWQSMYQQAYYEYLYTKYGIYQDTNKILTSYASAADYGISMASYYTTQALNSGLNSIKDYLLELVAGADAAVNAGLKYEAHDKEEAKSMVTWMQSVYVNSQWASTATFKSFLNLCVGDTFQMSDIEDAARLLIMYSKYSDYKSLDLDDDASESILQDFILKNPAGHFEAKYYSFTGANEKMIRAFFTDLFMEKNAKNAFAKHFANIDRLALVDLKDDALTEKLTELGMNTFTEYTKTVGEDDKASYSPALNDKIGEYIFSTSMKAGTAAVIAGEDSAFLIYFDKTSTTDKATISFKEYKYSDIESELAEITDVDKLLADCIKAGENVTDYESAKDMAEALLDDLNADKDKPMEDATIAHTTKDSAKDEANTVPEKILDVLYAKDAKVKKNWNFVVNESGISYVVKVTDIDETTSGELTTNYTISYVTFEDSFFCALLRSFEAEFSLYLLDSSTAAPTYSLTYETFKTQVLNWVMDENYEKLVLQRYANEDLKALNEAKKDSNKDVFTTALTNLGITKGVHGSTNQFKKEIDSALYDFLFNSKNKDTLSVIVGEDSVYLAYVYPANETAGGTTASADESIVVVEAGWKEYKLDDYATKVEGFYDSILKDLTEDDRENTTDHKSAEDLAKEELDALKKTSSPKDWPTEGITTVTTTKPLDKNDPNTAPKVILDKIYGTSGTSATSVKVDVNAYYQVDNNGTSYVFKVVSVPTTGDKTLKCEIEYQTFEDSEYYSYFRAIKSKLDSSFKKDASTLTYPESVSGAFNTWITEGEYKAAEEGKTSEHVFDRVKDDYTFVATTDSKNNITGFTLYLVDEPMKQEKDDDATVYGGYLLFETEKEANKALKQLAGKTDFALFDKFTSLKVTKSNGTGDPTVTTATIDFALTKSSISDDNLENWLFSADRRANDTAVVESKDGKFYVAIFKSSEATWLRTARTDWVDAELTEHIQSLIKDGGYELNAKAMEKVEGVITTAATTPATK